MGLLSKLVSKALPLLGKVAPLAALVPGIGIPIAAGLKLAGAAASALSARGAAGAATAATQAVARFSPGLSRFQGMFNKRPMLGNAVRASATATGIAATGFLVGRNASVVQPPRQMLDPQLLPEPRRRKRRKKKSTTTSRGAPSYVDTEMERRAYEAGRRAASRSKPRRRSTKAPTARQLEAREEFARRARSGEFSQRQRQRQPIGRR